MTNTILLADDSVTIQKVIELTFMDQDYEVVSVGDGDEALDELEQIAPDVVIADVHMPGASGYDVARRSKQLHPRSPVLVLVGTFEPFDEADVEAAGADGYLKKPFDSQELLQRVGELLAAREEAGAEDDAVTPEAAGAAGDEPSAIFRAGAPSLLESEAAGWAPPAAPGGDEEETAESLGSAWDEETGPWREPAPGAVGGAGTWDELAAGPSDDTDEPTLDETSDRLRDREPAIPETSFEPGALDEAEERGLGPQEPGTYEADSSEPTGEETTWVPDWQAPPAGAPGRQAEARETGRAGSAAGGGDPFPGLSRPPAAPAAPPATPGAATTPAAAPAGRLTDDDVDRVARRVAELLGDQVVREVAWEVVPDLAEVVIKDRLRELESQLD